MVLTSLFASKLLLLAAAIVKTAAALDYQGNWMPTPPEVHAAITDARGMPDGKWPARWKYPDPDSDKARAVWDTLKPARDYLEGACGESFHPEVGENASETVTRIGERIMDHAVGATTVSKNTRGKI